jgi:hypothetical protein
MARVRSPNYPALSLPEAITSITRIHAAEQHLAAPKEVVARHLGYTTYHGLAGRVISAVEKYGLLEEVNGDKVRVSPLALSILFPQSASEKQNAINEAAFKPPLFASIKEEWQGSRPSDQNLRVYLIRRKFSSDALDRVIELYKETMDLVTQDSGVYSAPESEQPAKKQEHPPMPTQATSPATGGRVTSLPSPVQPSVPMRVLFNGDLLEVSAVLTDAAAVDRLVKALEANKALLPLTSKKDEAAN